MGGVKADNPQITLIIQELYRNRPTLFETLLTKPEQHSLREKLNEHKKDDPIALKLDILH